jgi:hypothetical protein
LALLVRNAQGIGNEERVGGGDLGRFLGDRAEACSPFGNLFGICFGLGRDLVEQLVDRN